MQTSTPFSHNLLDRMFGIDLRALATFRIGVGLLLLYDLVTRGFYLEEHYTDFGVLPRADLTGTLWNPWYWSLHCLSGEITWQAVLFVVAGVAAVMLTVGWQTRIAGWLSWILLLSLHGRNPIVLQGGDVLLRTMLFWSLWLPWHAVGSLDARRLNVQPPRRIHSVASAGLLLQLAMMYIFSGFMKNDPIWERDGTAIFYTLQLDGLRTVLGEWLVEHRDLCRLMSFGALYLERFGPLLAFIPWRTSVWRCLTVLSFWGLHLGLIATMLLGHFPYFCILCWVLYLPSSTWDWLQTMAGRCGMHWRVPGVNDEQPPTDDRRRLPLRVLDNSLALMLLLLVFWNVRVVWPMKWMRQFDYLDAVVLVPRLDQSWGMFAPYPLRDDGWWLMIGTTRDGKQVNLWSPNEPVSTDKPDLRRFYPHERWRKYLLNLWQVEYIPSRTPFLNWLVRRWNRDHARNPGELIQTGELHFWLEESTLDGQPPWEELKLLKLDFSDEKKPPAEK